MTLLDQLEAKVAMQYTESEYKEILHCIMDMGELFMGSGGEISRVEDTLSRMGKAYGAEKMEVFVITSSIVVTMVLPGGASMTETRRIDSSGSTNFSRFERLNELSRLCCRSPYSPEVLRKKLDEIGATEPDQRLLLAGSVLAGASLAVFFGASLWEGVIAGFFGAVISLLQMLIGRTRLNSAASNLLISFVVALAAGLFCRLVPSLSSDRILIGDIMLLIPGIAMTNAIRNMLVGNPLSGSVRLVESLIWAGALAGGTMTAMLLLSMF